MENVRRCQSEKNIAGDTNAKLAEWGSPTTDARGTLLVRRATRSFIDDKLASQKIQSITNRRVLDDETLTEHKFIEYNTDIKSANTNKYPSIVDWEVCTTLI
ncbi:hypothetical protein JTB14_001586 [Gonioctena quinquepunctata]|nr:hypothetical protein JTB14_001586 [Gonioctena quinquepunctata]